MMVMRKTESHNYRVARTGTARAINRRIVLNLIRKHQPVSRADLARFSGLQRSTVSAITEQLIAERWVTRGASGNLPRGRKPIFIHLNSDRAGIVGIDLRPIMSTVALARLDASFFAHATIPTKGTADHFVAQLCRRVQGLIKAYPGICFEGIGVSLPGRVDSRSRKLVFAPNLPWNELELKQPLERATGLPVELENAANACALAEIFCEPHTDIVRDLMVVTVSEGIGVGMVFNGQLARGASGLAGEFGHVPVVEDGVPCRCGNRGCWEAYASTMATVKYYEQSLGKKTADQNGGQTSFGDIIARAKEGDVKAGEALRHMAHYLGVGMAMLVSGCAPEAIVVVGSVTEVWDRIEPVIRDAMARRCSQLKLPQILPTDSAAQPRLRGAIALVLQKHFNVPQIP